MAKSEAPLAWLAKVFDEYGQLKIRAEVVAVQLDGELYGVSESEYDGLQVSAYIGHAYSPAADTDPGRVWGIGVRYEPHHIGSASHAAAIARVFGRIEKGLDRLASEEGYLRDGDYAQHLLRVGRVLRIRDVYVRPRRRTRDMTGRQFKKVDGSGLQYWAHDVADLAAKGEARREFIDR